jgi:isopentenyldiphosphate isomerase
MMNKPGNDWRLIGDYPVTNYKCGLKAGNHVRLRADLLVRDHEGKPTGIIHRAGEIWRVLPGAEYGAVVIWLRQPNGERHTWDDNPTVFDAFELVNEEIFDVVNERDEVVGQAPRSEVHAKRLLHRAVHVLVFNAAGEVFLQKRSMSKDTAKGQWDSSASGHLDAGEDYDACAVRELREEIGLQLDRPPERILRLEACAETGQEFVWVYRCTSEGPFTLHPEEIERGDWFAPEAVTQWVAQRPEDLARAFRSIWGRVVNANAIPAAKKV